jgi:hypothetical protein
MASIVPGYEYDIFISYRQKDNKQDNWVTEFVENLKGELEATFKEDISVYFDSNPHDGLLESHDVGESLREKLKCVIFIPIISRTYCDPKSFAWEHEFKAFVELASKDRYGLKVKLHGGNVASRVLPVRIYDLNKEDINLCETVLGGPLRGIEFIYKSAGVNRPLRANEDHAQNNLNKTFYRDQINKMSHSIEEIIQGLVKEVQGSTLNEPGFGSGGKIEFKKSEQVIHRRSFFNLSRSKIVYVVLSLLLIFTVFVSYQTLFKRRSVNGYKSEDILNKAIAVCDPLSSWANYTGKIRIIYEKPDGKIYSDQIIEIQTKENYYKCSSVFFGKFKVISGIQDGKCFIDAENPEAYEIKQIGFNDKLISGLKDHHYCIFGLLMQLKSSGLTLNDQVEINKFQGQDCFVLSFSGDSTKVGSDYFKANEWTVYIDQVTYFLKGYNSKGKFNWTSSFSGYFTVGDIKIPLTRINYNTVDNSLHSVELLMLPE